MFSISEISVGAGGLGLCPLPQAVDVARLRDWRADLVLTLVEGAEAAELSPDLAAALAAKGIAQRCFPIADYGVPVGGWPAVSADLHAILAQGGRIVVHCRGGCGRTGMIALRLMVELGEEPDAALARLRAVRPCAVETEEQRLWASA
ncbi:protein-tyrosine phosphatase family protein [Pseudorhodobacter sp. W20_MBD10_FR17]|uniref:phosphatase domain-containing protein n=1 Tax=Pseudorhodobacter sp. W20_MBD10_FR17 TaxID=3240266 RepID=UPI003F99055F